MSDTMTRTFVLGTLTTAQGATLPAIHYIFPETPERLACYDWNGDFTESGPRHVAGEYVATYTKPDGWIFTPDTPDEPFLPETETRESLGAALALMRQREAAAIRDRDFAINQRDFAQRSLSSLRERVDALADALLEQAEERDWCGEYEEFQSNFSDLLKTREREYSVTLTVTVTGRDADRSDLASAIYEMSSYDIESAINDYDVS